MQFYTANWINLYILNRSLVYSQGRQFSQWAPVISKKLTDDLD